MYYITFDDVKITITNIDDIKTINNPENVKVLSLYNNNLTELDKDICSNLTQLKYLDLGFNKLTELDKDIFSNLTQLQQLNLGVNLLTQLDKNIFSNLTQLKKLKLNNNKLTELDKNIFVNLTQLQVLKLSNNKLKNIPISIRHCKYLEFYKPEFDIPNYQYIDSLPYLVNKQIAHYYYKPVLDYYNSKYL